MLVESKDMYTIFLVAHSEAVWVASDIENHITGTEVQEVLVLHSLPFGGNWRKT